MVWFQLVVQLEEPGTPLPECSESSEMTRPHERTAFGRVLPVYVQWVQLQVAVVATAMRVAGAGYKKP